MEEDDMDINDSVDVLGRSINRVGDQNKNLQVRAKFLICARILTPGWSRCDISTIIKGGK